MNSRLQLQLKPSQIASVKVSSITSAMVATGQQTQLQQQQRHQTLAKQHHQSSSVSSSSSGGGGNAKYLRYVRSKLSKSRLNSVLSLSGGANKEQQQQQQSSSNHTPSLNSLAGSPEEQLRAINDSNGQTTEQTESSSRTIFEQQLSTSATSASFRQQAAVRHQAKGLLVRSSQRMDTVHSSSLVVADVHRPVGATRSSEPISPPPSNEQQQLEQVLSSAANQTPSRAQLKQQASISKKSNFFSGFRSTLRGRRGSKQAQQQQNKQLADQTQALEQLRNRQLLDKPPAVVSQQVISGSHSMGEITSTVETSSSTSTAATAAGATMVTSNERRQTTTTTTTSSSYFTTMSSSAMSVGSGSSSGQARGEDTPTTSSLDTTPEINVEKTITTLRFIQPVANESGQLFKTIKSLPRRDSLEQPSQE